MPRASLLSLDSVRQDLSICQRVVDEGRAIVVALNKVDAVDNGIESKRWATDQMAAFITDAQGGVCMAVRPRMVTRALLECRR